MMMAYDGFVGSKTAISGGLCIQYLDIQVIPFHMKTDHMENNG